MKYIYEEVMTESFTGKNTIIKRTDEDGSVWWIPTDPANSDYQAYLRWLVNPEAEENGSISEDYGKTLLSWPAATCTGR